MCLLAPFQIRKPLCFMKIYISPVGSLCVSPMISFLFSKGGKCTKQCVVLAPSGKCRVADYLGLPNPEANTGYCFRRTLLDSPGLILLT